MPEKPYKPCSYLMCRNLSREKYCVDHSLHDKEQRQQRNKLYDQKRRSEAEHKFYKTRQWQKVREIKYTQDPLCERCLKEGLIVATKIIDHIIPIKQGGARLDLNNLQSLCMSCHNKKTANERTTPATE